MGYQFRHPSLDVSGAQRRGLQAQRGSVRESSESSKFTFSPIEHLGCALCFNKVLVKKKIKFCNILFISYIQVPECFNGILSELLIHSVLVVLHSVSV